MSPPGERGRSVLSNQTLPVIPGMKTMMSASNSPPSVFTLSASKPTSLCPRWISMSRRCISAISRCSACSPRRLPGLGIGLKKASLMRSRRPSRRNWVSMPEQELEHRAAAHGRRLIGIAGEAEGHRPALQRGRAARAIARRAAMPSQGRIACSMPGSFLMKRPPQAMISPSFRIGPAVVSTVRPPSSSPVASAAPKLHALLAQELVERHHEIARACACPTAARSGWAGR